MMGIPGIKPMRASTALVAALAVLPLSLAACSKKEDPGPPPIIGNYVSGIQVLGQADATAEVKNEQLPAGTADGPVAEVGTEATVVNGGSLRQPVESSTAFKQVRMAIETVGPAPSADPSADPSTTDAPLPMPTSAGAPAKGYYEITLPAAGTTADLVLTIAQALPGTQFILHYAVVSESGAQGTAVVQAVQAKEVGTGQVQVSVSWDAASDVDLHVVDPAGDEVYYEQLSSASGGELDLDSNAECEIDNVNNENITWTEAPPGEYIVRLDYWDFCDVEQTNYVVTVRVVGQPAKVFNGEFTGEGDHGGIGDGIEITRFTVAAASPTP